MESAPSPSYASASDAVRCLNCEEPVTQNFCPNCGQEKTPQLVPASHLLHDAVDEFLKLDSKFGKTIVPLLTKPGLLTNEYIAGKRIRYVSPFRIYFIVSAIYFICFSFAHYDITVMHGLAFGIEHAHPAHLAGGEAAAVHEYAHTGSMTSITDMTAMQGGESDRAQRHHAAVERTSGWFIKNQSLITFLLVPFAALLLKLLYIGGQRLYIEHLVFAVHVQTFLFIALLIALVPFRRNETYIVALALGAGYLFLAMRRVYRQPAWATALKCTAMLAGYVMIMACICFGAFLAFYNAAA